jgi:hypothetical protein
MDPATVVPDGMLLVKCPLWIWNTQAGCWVEDTITKFKRSVYSGIRTVTNQESLTFTLGIIRNVLRIKEREIQDGN